MYTRRMMTKATLVGCRRSRLIRVVVTLLWVLTPVVQPAVQAAYPQPVHGSGGAVACAAPAAADAGIEVLEAGGNAVDAAVATALALAVVHPQAGNLGGGGFAVVRQGKTVTTLDFRETAPAGARPELYVDNTGQPISERSLIGPLASGVPGSPAGLFELHRRFGRLEWSMVVGPAQRLAENGFVVSERLSSDIVANRKLLERFPETAAVWLPGGKAPAAGDRVRLPELAATLKAYGAHGPAAIVDGPAAIAVEAVVQRYGGVLRAPDLEVYRPVWREPVRFGAFGWQLASMSLPSSGGVIFAQSAAMLEHLSWHEHPRFGADRTHLLVETWRRAYADRFLLGDPASTKVRISDLLAPTWLSRRAATVRLDQATPSSRVRPWLRQTARESQETTHLSVVDRDRCAVSLTTTLNGTFGCGLQVPGVGFFLNNEMDDFATAPGLPNQFGLIQGEANAVAAGRRMLSSMTPTIAWRGDEVLVLGSPGGSRIPTATMQVFLNIAVDGDQIQAAIDRPRVHHQWLPDVLNREPDALSPETANELVRRGHRLEKVDELGEVHATRIDPDGRCEAAADPRGPGGARVVSPAGGAS
jgi:gamma-glutamyltranspeptidase/glutathione hydrolase